MAEDPAAEQEMRQLEDRLREVGERLQAPPDDAEDLLNLLIVSLLSSFTAFSPLVDCYAYVRTALLRCVVCLLARLRLGLYRV